MFSDALMQVIAVSGKSKREKLQRYQAHSCPRDCLVSLGTMEIQLRAPLKPPPPEHHSTMVLRGLRGPLIGPLLFRETQRMEVFPVLMNLIVYTFI